MDDMVQKYQDQIISEMNLGNYDSAISICKKLLRIDEKNWRAKFYLGFCEACKKQSMEYSDDVVEMNRHIEKTWKDISRIGLIEQEFACCEISKYLIEYATNCENELQKVNERNNGEYAPALLRRRAFRVYGMLLSTEKLFSGQAIAKKAVNLLIEAAKEFKEVYPLLADQEKEEKADRKALFRKGFLKNPFKAAGKSKWNSSCFLTVILAVILFLASVYTLKTLYTFLYIRHVQQIEEEAAKLPIFYYESDQPVISGNTSYEPGSPLELLMDECRSSDVNPTLKVSDYLANDHISIQPCSIDLGPMKDIGMKIQPSDGSDEEQKTDLYEFSEKGCQTLLKDILRHMMDSKLFDDYSVKDIYSDVCHDMPEFAYSPENQPCYYTFLQIRFEGMTYLWQIYIGSDDGNSISEISAEMMGARYITGGGAGSGLHFNKLDLQIFANQMLFMEAAEHSLAGKHEISNVLDWSEATVSDTIANEFAAENGDWTESMRFYQSDNSAGSEAWKGNYLLKAEMRLERK